MKLNVKAMAAAPHLYGPPKEIDMSVKQTQANIADTIPSTARIVLASGVISGCVLGSSLFLQWLVYTDWLNHSGPLRIVGSSLAAALTFVLVYRWQSAARERRSEMLRRFETIARMNDKIRNALQVIECTAYRYSPDATEPVRTAVTVIDGVLREVLADAHPAASGVQKRKRAAASDTTAKPKPA